jgi:hypothetical protein
MHLDLFIVYTLQLNDIYELPDSKIIEILNNELSDLITDLLLLCLPQGRNPALPLVPHILAASPADRGLSSCLLPIRADLLFWWAVRR